MALIATVVGATVLLGSPALFAHDWMGTFVEAPELSVVIVEADMGMADAAERARQAGAEAVWATRTDGLVDVLTAPDSLRAGSDGRVRFDGEHRLPLPEAMSSPLVLQASQLGPGTPASLLRGHEVVLRDLSSVRAHNAASWRAPWATDAAAVLAVARGASLADAHLNVIPRWLAALMCAALALAVGPWFMRRELGEALPVALLGSTLVVGLAWLGRWYGWDTPFLGAMAAIALPAVANLLIGRWVQPVRSIAIVLRTPDAAPMRASLQSGEAQPAHD